MKRHRTTLFVRLAVGAVLCVAAAAAGACGRGPQPRRVEVRLTDLVHGAVASPRYSTATYPHATIAQETRPVLSAPPDLNTLLSRTHASIDVNVPPRARLEFGLGVRIDGKSDAEVKFDVTARTADGQRRLLSREVEADEANVWQDFEVALDGISGKVTLDFVSSATVSGIGPGQGRATAYFSEPVVTARERKDARRRNVILISVDTLGAEHLELYGYERETAPNLERIFGDDGLVVDRFYTNATDTLRAHAALLSGYLPTTALNGHDDVPRIAPWATLLAEHLRAAGHRTAAFTEDGWLGAAFGFYRGFERYDEQANASHPSARAKRGGADPAAAAGARAHGIERTFAKATAWVEDQRQQPFFLFVHTARLRSPYEPPASHAGTFEVPADAPAAVADAAAYDADIRYVDEQIGGFVDHLDELDVLDDTVLIVTSDHGEEFGEHGRRFHGTHLYDEVLRVPLLMRAPGLLPSGVRRSGPMSSVDVLPTLGNLLAFGIHSERDGESFSTHIVDGAAPEPIAAYHEAHIPEAHTYTRRDDDWIPPSFAITAWPRRLIRIRTADGARYEMYDLEADPEARTDLYPRSHKRIAFLRARLDRYQDFRSRRAVELAREATADAPPSPPAGPAHAEVSETQLRAVGYPQ